MGGFRFLLEPTPTFVVYIVSSYGAAVTEFGSCYVAKKSACYFLTAETSFIIHFSDCCIFDKRALC